MDCCEAIKTAPSLVYGFGVEKELCSPYDFLNLRQFVGESGVNPTLEGGGRGELLNGVGLTVFLQ